MDLVVPPRLKVVADQAVRRVYRLVMERQENEQLLKKPPTYLRDALDELRQVVRERIKEINREINRVIEESGVMNHPVSHLATGQGLPKIFALGFVANPPQVTTVRFGKDRGCFITTTSWMYHGFIPVRIDDRRVHANKLSKACYRAWYTFATLQIKRIVQTYPEVARIYRAKLEQYGGDKRARRLALRDMLRVFVGNAWLVWIWSALNAGIIEPDDVVLPYELAEAPDPVERAKTWIDPRHTFVRWFMIKHPILSRSAVEATWVQLVRRVTRR